jgi:hypothetical protein
MRHIFLFTITALFISGCVDLLPSKSNNSGAVVVNCLLNDDDVQKLKLTRTSNVEGSNGFDFITHAKAYLFELSESGSHLKGEFKFIGNGDYTLDCAICFLTLYLYNPCKSVSSDKLNRLRNSSKANV